MSVKLNPRRAPLGRTGLSITRIGFGAWAIGGQTGKWNWGPQDDDDSVAAIHHAVSSGINWVDTAPIYGLGHGEEVVGRALAALPAADRPLVFTKCGLTWDDGYSEQRVGRPQVIRDGADDSLKRLGVETLDLLQLHWPPLDGTPIEESWGALVDLRQSGKARFVGVSNCNAEQLSRLEAIGTVDTVQPPLSLINRDALDDGTLAWSEQNGSGVICYSPMQSGILTGKYTEETVAGLSRSDWRRESPDFNEPGLSRNLGLINSLRTIAATTGSTVGELAIAWVLHQRGVTGAIVGARSTHQIDGWIGAGDVTLDSSTLNDIADALRLTGAGTGPRAY
jgi:aryl-alcohol dehydrogenase-like predicted oxidoreductase